MSVFWLEITMRERLIVECNTYAEAEVRAATLTAERNAGHHHGERTVISVVDPNAKKECFYFGCLGETGHYLYGGKRSSTRMVDEYAALPWTIAHIDSGLLVNGDEPDKVTGRVLSTCGKKGERWWWAFVWWDRSVDKRGASNSGFYISGFGPNDRDEAFKYACFRWSQVVERQTCGLVLV